MGITLGKAIKVIREAKGASLGSLARDAKISVSYLCLVEGDKRNPSMDVMDRLADVLEIPADLLVIVATQERGSLRSKSDVAYRLLEMLNQMETFEKRIRDAVES